MVTSVPLYPAAPNDAVYNIEPLVSTQSSRDYHYVVGIQDPAPFQFRVEERLPSDYIGFLTGEIAPGWILVKPILITIERDVDYMIVSDDVFAIYGVGDTFEDALDDYKVSLIDYFELISLRAEADVHTRFILNQLRKYLCPINQ